MSAHAWLAEREPVPPASLARRVAELYEAGAGGAGDPAPARCVEAAARAVGTLIAERATTRASALDLLAADALATYAFELASEQPETLGALADDAMRRFAALGAAAGRTP